MKTDGTYSGTYYTANDQGMSGLKLMGLMAAATAPFQQKLSNELMGSQHKVEGEHKLPAKQHPISPLVMEQPPPEIEKTKKKRSKRAREKKKQIEIENLGVSDPDAETKPDIDGETPKANLPFPEIKESATNADNNHLQVPKTKRKKKRKKPQQDAAPEMQPETVLPPETTAQEDDRVRSVIGTAPGGTTPGGTIPGGTTSVGTTPGGTTPGGTTPGGTIPRNVHLCCVPLSTIQRVSGCPPGGWCIRKPFVVRGWCLL